MGRTHLALHLALQLLGVGRGDLVATSTLTAAASANAIRYVGAEPLFLDCDPQTWNMDPQLLALALEAGVQRGTRIKAVLAVDICGQCADFAPIRRHCQYRLSNLLAAVGRGQLRVLDQRVAQRRANFAFYQEALGDLPGIAFMPEHRQTCPVLCSLFVVRWQLAVRGHQRRDPLGVGSREYRVAADVEAAAEKLKS